MPSVDEPVSLEANDPQWPIRFRTEASRLAEALQGLALGIEHVFFSSYDADTNRQSLRDAGLALVIDEVVSNREPDGDAAFLWVLARRPAA